MEDDKFKAMSDEKLVTIANSRLWASSEEGKAAAELYRREKAGEVKKSSIQRQIRNMTIAILIIAAITLFFTMLPLFQKGLKVFLFSPNIEPHKEYNQPTDPNNKKENALRPPKTDKLIDKNINNKTS